MAIRDEVVYTAPLDPDLGIRPDPEEVRRQALEGIPELRALRAEILASRGGKPILSRNWWARCTKPARCRGKRGGPADLFGGDRCGFA